MNPFHPLALGAVGAILVGSALVAIYVPSRRAADVDPAPTLRDDG